MRFMEIYQARVDPQMGYKKAYADAETPSPPAQAEPYTSQHPPLAPLVV
ncbi:hypothetical protein A2U01_0118754, partial [Trifolium medium]|nr:hypothetical protein [Trifolium medium]